jgi:hypothetical protein
MEQWLRDGTVTQEYLDLVLGDQTKSVPPIRVLTKEDILKMDCPFPPEPDYD